MMPTFRVAGIFLWLFLAVTCTHAQKANWQRDSGFPSGDAVTGLIALDDGTLIAGTASNGIYMAPAFGAPWEAKSNGLASKKVRSLIITGPGALVVGTQDMGIFRSDDGGDSWQPSNSGMTGTEIDNLVAGRDGTLYAASTRGVHISTNDGHTWTPIGPQGRQIWTLAVGANAAIYAAEPTVGAYRSTDRGTNWTTMQLNASGIIVMKVSPGGAIFAGASSIYRSTDGGGTWTTIPVNTDLISAIEWNGVGHMFIGAIDGVYRSVDNGTTWVPFTDGMDRGAVSALAATSDGVVFAGTFNGRLYRTGSSTSSVAYSTTNVNMGATACSIAPNPMHALGTLSFTSAAGCRVEISLHNALGQRLQVLRSEEMEAGIHRIPFDVSRIPAGVLFCRIDCGGAVTSLPIVVSH
ncbi:MAG: hypothetical protein JST22_11735 [Bacteroidetes bacterium]|nr:hypothetical protein [Bacteroidota bacterium]